ncbi:MAG TPA: hypothetical protein VKA75_01935, partial [Reyranella sp.]|nr:hypothetical protein [Reyranella sp.]
MLLRWRCCLTLLRCRLWRRGLLLRRRRRTRRGRSSLLPGRLGGAAFLLSLRRRLGRRLRRGLRRLGLLGLRRRC